MPGGGFPFQTEPLSGICFFVRLRLTSATIGYWREDGDFAVLATLDNNGEEYSTEVFVAIVHAVTEKQQAELECDGIEILPNREDAVAILEGSQLEKGGSDGSN